MLLYIIIVITSLFTVAKTTISFDPSLILITWKTLGKLLCLMKNHVFDNSDINVISVISGMCDGLITKSQESIKIIINSYKVFVLITSFIIIIIIIGRKWFTF